MRHLKFIGIILIAAAGVIAALWCYWPVMLKWTDDHEGAAAWAQALLSVGAIFIAAWTVNHAHRLQIRYHSQLEFDAYTRFLENAFQLAGAVGMVAEKIHKSESGVPTQQSGDLESMRIELEGLDRAVKSIDLGRLDRHEFILGIQSASFHARKLIATIERVSQPSFRRHLDGPLLQNEAHEAKLRIKSALTPLLSAIDKRGYRPPQDIRPS